MLFTLQDVAGLLLAMALAVPVLALPGAFFANVTGLLDFEAQPAARRLMVATLAGLAFVPLVASLVARFIGLDAALFAVLALAACGAFLARERLVPDWSRRTWTAIGMAVAVLAFAVIDLAWDGRLHPSLLIVDLVKHAAFTRSIVETGATPPADPFFLRAGAASYYYFFYTPAALIERLGFGVIDSRMAFAGLIPWVTLATAGLADLVYEKAGFARRAGERRVPLLLIVMSTAGLQLVFVVMFWLKGETWREQSGWLNEMVASFLTSVLWVPHHVAAFLVAWVGLLLLVDATADGVARSRRQIVQIAGAGAAFAATVGLSVWVALGAVATVGLWFAWSVFERRFDRVLAIAASGLVALLLIAPHLVDLSANRDFGAFPIAFRVRFFALAGAISGAIGGGDAIIRLVLLPLNYFWEAPLLVLGAVLFWKRRRIQGVVTNDVARLLALSAAASIFIGSFFAAAIANNDLGWRVLLFAQFAASLWTVHVVWPLWCRLSDRAADVAMLRFLPRPMVALAALGLLGGVHDVALLRLHVLVNQSHPEGQKHDPAVAFDERAAYGWLSHSKVASAVVQHNPDVVRAFAFGLYGRQRTAVSDLHQAVLFGAAPGAVSQRLGALMPLFKAGSTAEDAKRVLGMSGVDAVIVTSRDEAWRSQAAWVFKSPALLVRDNLRIVATGDLTDGPSR